jgi:two-component system, LytTR family, sensor kinase
MLLQPLVENAIKYGVSAQEEGARISLDAAIVGGTRLRLTVADTGPGIQTLQRQSDVLARGHSSTGVGLNNIAERLTQAYGDDHRFQIDTPPDGGFTVTIEIPLERDEPGETAPEALQPSPTPAVTDRSAMAGMSPAIGNPA